MKVYNKIRGPLAVTLADGRSLILASKIWTEIPQGFENASLIFHYLKKGYIYKEISLSEIKEVQETSIVSAEGVTTTAQEFDEQSVEKAEELLSIENLISAEKTAHKKRKKI